MTQLGTHGIGHVITWYGNKLPQLYMKSANSADVIARHLTRDDIMRVHALVAKRFSNNWFSTGACSLTEFQLRDTLEPTRWTVAEYLTELCKIDRLDQIWWMVELLQQYGRR